MDKYIVYNGSFDIKGIANTYEEACKIVRKCVLNDLYNVVVCMRVPKIFFIVHCGVIKSLHQFSGMYSSDDSIPEIKEERVEYNDEFIAYKIMNSDYRNQFIAQIIGKV